MQISTQTYFASFFEAKYWTNYVCIFIKKKHAYFNPDLPCLFLEAEYWTKYVCIFIKHVDFNPDLSETKYWTNYRYPDIPCHYSSATKY